MNTLTIKYSVYALTFGALVTGYPLSTEAQRVRLIGYFGRQPVPKRLHIGPLHGISSVRASHRRNGAAHALLGTPLGGGMIEENTQLYRDGYMIQTPNINLH